jgi:predicted RNase H-like HicB family nuclease
MIRKSEMAEDEFAPTTGEAPLMEYVVVIHTAEEGGFWAEVPALEGCYAQGETLDEVLADVRDAITSYIDALKEDGQPVPGSLPIVIATVSVPAA